MSRLIDVDEIKLPQRFFETVDNVPRFYGWLDEQPTVDAVPVQWIDEEINRLRSYDNAFSAMAASTIKAMLDKWRNNA